MTSEQFCYWLQGYFELKQTIDHREGATPETMKMIEDHLKTVFVKVTPALMPRGISYPLNHTIAWPGGITPVITC